MIKTKIIKPSFIALFISVSGFLPSLAFSQDFTDKNITQEIEQILLFNDDEKSKMQPNLYKKNRKDDFFIGEENDNSDQENKFDITVQKPNITINSDARTKEKMAYNASSSGQYEVAIEFYKQVLEIEPENSYAKLSLALIYQRLSQFSQAKKLYQELLKNNPQNKEEIIANLLSILSKESPRDAVYLISRLSAQHPNSDYLSAQAALIYSDLKNYNQAVNYMKKAIEINPARLDYKYNLAIIYDNSQNYEKAVENYLEVVKSYKSDTKWANLISISQVESRIESLKNKL